MDLQLQHIPEFQTRPNARSKVLEVDCVVFVVTGLKVHKAREPCRRASHERRCTVVKREQRQTVIFANAVVCQDVFESASEFLCQRAYLTSLRTAHNETALTLLRVLGTNVDKLVRGRGQCSVRFNLHGVTVINKQLNERIDVLAKWFASGDDHKRVARHALHRLYNIVRAKNCSCACIICITSGTCKIATCESNEYSGVTCERAFTLYCLEYGMNF